ncbi:DUF1493 family protein [Salmonella enterica subsp. enterica serovar Montevideo]|nr:DUF1493 family protein [Salmonella enterica subsp. enterica serovar Montevideo]
MLISSARSGRWLYD